MIVVQLDKILRERNLNQTQLAAQVGVDKNTISRWNRHGRKHISIDVLDALCRELGVTVGDLIVYIPDEEQEK